ncbi:MAG: DUF4082 domain-containing protein [Motilibacteraceae bacterium]
MPSTTTKREKLVTQGRRRPLVTLLAAGALVVPIGVAATGAADAAPVHHSWKNASTTVTPSVTAQTTSGTSSLWATSIVPGTTSANDSGSVELGVRFRSDVAGRVTGIRFYKGAGNTGTHTGSLWSSSGTRLATGTFTAETSSGWQTLVFATPVTITANTTYVASYHAPSGHYAFTSGYFSSTRDNGVLHAPASTSTAPNALFRYGSGGFPTGTYQAANYWVDVLFQASSTTSTSRPTASPTSSPTTSPTAAPTTSPTASSSPTASASPTATATSSPTASSGSTWPGATNTGVPAGTTLTKVSGNYRVTTPGAVISGLDIEGSLVIAADNVTVKNTRVRGIGEPSWVVSLATHSTLQDVEIGGGASGTDWSLATAIYSGGNTSGNKIIRVNMHHTQDGVRLDGGTTLQDSWIHQLNYGGGAHSDGIQATQGDNDVVRHNTIEGGNNDSIFLQTTGGDPQIHNVTIDGNLLLGTTSGSALSSYGVSNETASNVSLTNNVFNRTWQVGATGGSFVSFSGNTYTDGSAVK